MTPALSARSGQQRGVAPGDTALRDLQSVDLFEALLDDLTAQPPIEFDGTRVAIEHPEISPRLAATSDPPHGRAQQAAAKAAAPPLRVDVKIVDVGAEARIALRPRRDEAQPVVDQHHIGRRHRGELAAPVCPSLAVEGRAERAVLQDAAIGGTPACGVESRDGIGVGNGCRADRFIHEGDCPSLAAGWLGSPSASFTHESFDLTNVWSRGGTCSGSSSEDVVMSSSPGERVDWNVKGVPHDAQKVRWACSEDLKVAGSSDRNRNDATGTLNQATNGAPLV